MREKTLFVGNGLNRTIKSSVSWDELMARLGSTEPEGSGVPFPIEFEQIAARNGCSVGRRNIDPYKELRAKLAGIIESTQVDTGPAHEAFKGLPFDHFVTTNYDTVFEKMFDCKDALTNVGSSRNVLGAIFKSGERDFYHAHGISKWKNTLCLGHEHYATLIGKIRSKFYPGDNERNGKRSSNLQDLVTCNAAPIGIWPELFLTSDVAIIGFGLDYSESDIWWLLALRASLFVPHNKLSKFENVVTYYKAEIKGKEISMQESCRLNALASLGVRVERVQANDYEQAYLRAAEMISDEW